MKIAPPISGFDTTPKPAFLLAMQNQKWHVTGAISELVDNSFGPGRGNAQRVKVIFDPKRQIVSVLDDGVGMETIGQLFQLGETVGRTPGDIGLYGSGGTMAILWLAKEVELWTLRNGEVSHDKVNWPLQIRTNKYPLISTSWKKASFSNTPVQLLELGHGTLVRLHLARGRTVRPSHVKQELSRTYSPALRRGKKITWITLATDGKTKAREDLRPTLELPHDPERRVTFQTIIEIPNDEDDGVIHLLAMGEIGLIDDLPHSQSVVSIGYGCRVIQETRDCYSSPDRSETFAGIGIAGYLDLGDAWTPFLATTKDAIHHGPAYDALMARVFTKIRPLLLECEDEKLNIILTDLELALNAAFNGSLKMPENVGAMAQPHAEEPTRDLTDEPGSVSVKTTARPGTTSEEMPAVCKIEIQECTDAEMESILCKADPRPGGMAVFINKDHSFVRAAMRSKPINRWLLNHMVLREVTVAMVDDELLLARAFGAKETEKLSELSPRAREGKVMRALIDRVREPILT